MAVRLHPAFAGLRDARARLVVAFRLGELDGPALHAELSTVMDDAIIATWRGLATPATGAALVALGGYGRGLLAPGSDVDLMILHEGVARIGDAGQPLWYALWDAGIKVGHAVRTPKESLALAATNLEAETSFLDARLLDGDERLFRTFADQARAFTRKRDHRFVADVREMMRLRHAAHGSATSQLEPNIKEGTGGLRDLHVLDWFAAVVGDLRDLQLLDDAGRDELDRAHRFLLTARAHLHLETGGSNDALLFHLQRPIATALGYVDDGVIAEDAFMRDLFTATRAVELTVISVAADLAARGSRIARHAARRGPFVVAGERVLLEGALDLARHPEDAIALFTLDAAPGAYAMRAVRRALDGATLPTTPAVTGAFLELLRAASGQLLEVADHAGLFAALFDEWDAVRLQPQRNVYHRYTVDAHLFHTAHAAATMLRSRDADVIGRAVADLDDRDGDVLLLAALFHDVGKGTDEEHCVRGERLVRAMAMRLGRSDDDVEDLAWLVRDHLALVETAMRRDLSDPALVSEVAARIGTPRRARLLFLLTVADGIGTGPAAWTPWKRDLVSELFSKVVHVLERGDLAHADLDDLVKERTDAVIRVAVGTASRSVAHLEAMGRAYLLRFEPDEIVRHASLAHDLEGHEVRTVHRTLEDGSGELTVIAPDVPGLFRRVCGVLALHSLSIVTAEIHTRHDGVAFEWLRCVGPRQLPIEEERWDKIEPDLERVLHGKLSLEARLAEKRSSSARASRGKQEAPRVLCDNSVSDAMTVVEVHATDRLGLLYDITAALAECGLDVHRAKIATYGDDVVDVFYVRDLAGEKISDPEHLGEIERAILHRLR